MEALNEIEELINLGVEDNHFPQIQKKNCFKYTESKIILLQGRFLLKKFDDTKFEDFLSYLDLIENVTINGIPEKFKSLYIEIWIKEYLEILKSILDNASIEISNKVTEAFGVILDKGLELFTKFLKNKGKSIENSSLTFLKILELIPMNSKDISDLFLECISYNYLMGKFTSGEYESVHIIVYKILTAILKSNKYIFGSRRAFIKELFEFAIEISYSFLMKKFLTEELFISVFKFALECVYNNFFDHIRMLDDHKYVFKNIWGFVIYIYAEIYQKTTKFDISNQILEISKQKIMNKLLGNLNQIDDCLEMFTNLFHEIYEDHLSDKLSDILIEILKLGDQAETKIDFLEYYKSRLESNLFSNQKYIKFLKKLLIISSKSTRSGVFQKLKLEISPVKKFENMMMVYNLFDDVDEKYVKKIAIKLFKNYLIEQNKNSYKNLLIFCEKYQSLLLRIELEMLRKILMNDEKIMLKQKYFKVAYEKVLIVINPLYGVKFDDNILLPIDRNKLNDLWIYLTFFEQAGKVFGFNADFTYIFSLLSKLSREFIIEKSIKLIKSSKILKSRLIFTILQEKIAELVKETYDIKKIGNNLSLVYCIAIHCHLSNLYSSKYFLPLVFSYLSQDPSLNGDFKIIYTKILINIITESFHTLMHAKINYELWSEKLIYDIYELMESSISHIKIVKETAQEMLCLYFSKFKGKNSMKLKSCYLYCFPWIFQYKDIINKALAIYYELNKIEKLQKDEENDIKFFRKFIHEGLFKSFKCNKTAFSSVISTILYEMKNLSSNENEFKIKTLNNIYWEFTAKKMNKTFCLNKSLSMKIKDNNLNKTTELIQDQDISSKLSLLTKNSRLVKKFNIKENQLNTPIINLTAQLILDGNISNIQFYFNYLCRISFTPGEINDYIWCWKWIIYTKRNYIENLFENLEKEWKKILNYGGMVASQSSYINKYKLKYESSLFINTQSTYYNDRYNTWVNSTNLEDIILSQSRFLQFLSKECIHISIISEKALTNIASIINEFLSKSINPSILDSQNCLYELILCLVLIIKHTQLIHKFRFLKSKFIDFSIFMFMYSSKWVIWNSGEKSEKFYKLILNLMELIANLELEETSEEHTQNRFFLQKIEDHQFLKGEELNSLITIKRELLLILLHSKLKNNFPNKTEAFSYNQPPHPSCLESLLECSSKNVYLMVSFYDSLDNIDQQNLLPRFSQFYNSLTLGDSITEKQYLFSSFVSYPELLKLLISNNPYERSFGLKHIERSQKITQINLFQNIITIGNSSLDWELYSRYEGEENIWTYIYKISSNSPEMAMIILNTLEILIINQNKVANTIAKMIYKKIMNSLKQDWLNWKIYIEESNYFSNLALLSYQNSEENFEKLNQMISTNSSFTAWVPPFPLLKIKEISLENCSIADDPPSISFPYISYENQKRFLIINTSNYLKYYQFYNQIFFYLDEIAKISGLPFKFWRCNFLNLFFSFEKDDVIGNIIDHDCLEGNTLIIDDLPKIDDKSKENFIKSYAGYSLSFFLMNIFIKGDKIFNISDDFSILSLNLNNIELISHNRLGVEKPIFSWLIQGDPHMFNIYKNTVIQGYQTFRSYIPILYPLFHTIENSSPIFKGISKSFTKKICKNKSSTQALNFINQQIFDLDTSI